MSFLLKRSIVYLHSFCCDLFVAEIPSRNWKQGGSPAQIAERHGGSGRGRPRRCIPDYFDQSKTPNMEETRRTYIKISSQRMRIFPLDPTALVLAGKEDFAWSIPGVGRGCAESTLAIYFRFFPKASWQRPPIIPLTD